MDKKIAGVIGAIATLSTMGGANAVTPPVDPADILKAESLGDLLKPVPDAVAALRAIDAVVPAQPRDGEQVAQYYDRRFYHHHHHHHHHHHANVLRVVPGVVIVAPRRRYYHHHHHHHHSFYRRDY